MPPRFSPRDHIDPPRAFWDEHLNGRWHAPKSDHEATQVLVAHYLSQISRAVVAVLRETNRSRKDLAEAVGEDPRNVRRKVNGEYPATFEDILRWALALDRPDIVFVPNRSSDLFPDGLEEDLRRRLLASGPE